MAAPKTRHVDRVINAATTKAAFSSLYASWRRSLVSHGLDPAKRPKPDRLSDYEINQKAEASALILEAAMPKLDALHALVGAAGCGVFLTNAEGVVLETRCAPGDLDHFDRCGLAKGADWSEAAEGTNGIGTCLTEKRQLVIHRDEHFMASHTSISCIDAPIFDANGEIAGALDVSTARYDHDHRSNALIAASVNSVAQQIEMDMFRLAFPNHRIVLANTGEISQAAALLALDSDDLIVGATRAARMSLDVPLTGTFEPRAYPKTNPDESLKGLQRAEKVAIRRAINKSQGNMSKAADYLGIGRATLYRRMKRLGIS